MDSRKKWSTLLKYLSWPQECFIYLCLAWQDYAPGSWTERGRHTHGIFLTLHSTGELDLDCYRQIYVSFFLFPVLHLLTSCDLHIYFKMDLGV